MDIDPRTCPLLVSTEQTTHKSAWQPIETAPKDGPFVGGQHHPIYGWIWGRCARYQHGDGVSYIAGDVTPTHWMPLPEPPT